ncbi:3362_t:CDS:10, partial [Funneliformis caledonium]
LAIPILIEKLGDIKLKKSAGDALTAFTEKISLQFVFSQAYDPLRKAKAPKILADSLTWMHGAIMEFGIAALQVRELIEFLKFALSSSNAAVRTNSVTVLGALRVFVGPDIRTFVQDLNPTQLATIDSEFEKVADKAPPKALKTSVDVISTGGSGKDTLEELFPKVDISAQFTSKMMAECNDDKWKVRKDALDQVLAIVDANKKIKPSLGDFIPILKARLSDSNKNLQMMALDITAKLATAMGKPFDRHVKILVAPVTAVLTDKKATVRGSAIGTLDALANACGLDPLIGSFSTSLATDNPLLRKDLLMDGGQQLSKALNVSMVKVLENSNRNRTYSALISILEKSSSNLREVDAATATTQTKFTELIMKCLWKLAKTVQDNLKAGILSPNQLLRDLNSFFLATPPAEWKRRAAEKVPLGEMPLRTVKTLLLELVTGLGDNVYEHLDLIEDPQRSYVYPYLHHMIEATKKKDKLANNSTIAYNHISSRSSSISSVRSFSSPGSDLTLATTDTARSSPLNEASIKNNSSAKNSSSRSSPPARSSPVPEVPGHINETMSNASEPVSPASPRTPMTPKFPTPTSSARSSGSHEVEMNARLTQIFLKIGTREETKKGIYELYEFQKLHPEMEGKITTQLSRTGPYFQSYIRRGLANIAIEEEEKERANVIAEVKNLFPQNSNNHDKTEDNIIPTEDDQRKIKLLRLQQIFGFQAINEINEENENIS